MSDVTTPPAEEVPAVDALPVRDMTTPDGIALAIADAGDARYEEDSLPKLVELRANIEAAAASVVSAVTRVVNARKRAAEFNADIRRYILTDSGPDWAGATGAYQKLVSDVYTTAFGDRDRFSKAEAEREANAIKQHVNRTYRELAIRRFTRETQENMPAEGEPDTPNFLHAVKSEYLRCGLTPPNAYLSPEERAAQGGSGGGPGNDPSSVKDVMEKAAQGVGQVTPKLAASHLLRVASDLVASFTDPKNGSVTDRKDVAEILQRAEIVLGIGVKALDGKATPADLESLTEVSWKTEDAA